MTLVRKIGAHEYVPLRGVPVITGGVLDAATVVDLIRSPDRYCDHNYSEVISPLRLDTDGSLKPVDYRAFASWKPRRKKQVLQPLAESTSLPAGQLVALDAVREKYELVMNELVLKGKMKLPKCHVSFDSSPQLPPDQLAMLNEGLPPPRANSALMRRSAILIAFKAIATRLKDHGITLDHTQLPGTSKDWLRLMGPLAPDLTTLSPSTFKDHCKGCGLRWVQGKNPPLMAQVKYALRCGV
jgi:hypothetical protein